MKKAFYFAVPVLMLSSSVLIAQPPGGGRGQDGDRGPGRGGQGGDSAAMLERMLNFDENKDGKLSKEEVPERLQSMFARADKDEDGFLTKDEITQDLRSRQGGRPGEGQEGRRPRGGEGAPGQGGRGGRGGEGGPGGGRGGFGGPGGQAPPSPIMRALDADGDGQLSAEEINNAVAALKKLDQNKNGKLDVAELGSPRRGGFGGPGAGPGGPGGPGGGGPGMVASMLERFDKDKDGKLSGDEIPERMRENLARVDTNNDKSIDKSELEAMARQFQGGGGRGGAGRGAGRGPGGGRGGAGSEGAPRRRPPVEEE